MSPASNIPIHIATKFLQILLKILLTIPKLSLGFSWIILRVRISASALLNHLSHFERYVKFLQLNLYFFQLFNYFFHSLLIAQYVA